MSYRFLSFGLIAILFLCGAPAHAQLPGYADQRGFSELILRLVWAAGSIAGLIISVRISRAFRKGKLAIPWNLVAVAFAAFMMGSLISCADYYRLIDGFRTMTDIITTLGMVALLAAGYFYKRAVLR